ncbi:MAG TPA: PhnD/SsuA/transferrin family substrate-binding protein, partial [Candidatus Deferrimicrobiaceae bacterium]
MLIGILPEQNIFRQFERYEPLMAYLGRKTGVRFELKVLPRYGNIIENFKSSGLDGAFFGSFSYALAHMKMGVEVLARPVGLDNSSTYHGLIFVRKDSGILNVRGMKGKRFAFVDKATTAGYLLPLEYFHENGIDDYRKYLQE